VLDLKKGKMREELGGEGILKLKKGEDISN